MVEGIKNAVEFVRLHARPMTSAELQEILRIILNLIIEKSFYCLVNERIFLL